MESLTKEDKPRTVPASQPGPAKSAQKWAASRMARRLVTSPVSLYAWLSGPPMTSRDRMRAELADDRNSLYRRTLVL